MRKLKIIILQVIITLFAIGLFGFNSEFSLAAQNSSPGPAPSSSYVYPKTGFSQRTNEVLYVASAVLASTGSVLFAIGSYVSIGKRAKATNEVLIPSELVRSSKIEPSGNFDLLDINPGIKNGQEGIKPRDKGTKIEA